MNTFGRAMRNSTHIVMPLGVSETKHGLLQDRYRPLTVTVPLRVVKQVLP